MILRHLIIVAQRGGEPGDQRVGAQVFLHHQVRGACGLSRGSHVISRSCSASLPMRIGGFDQIASNVRSAGTCPATRHGCARSRWTWRWRGSGRARVRSRPLAQTSALGEANASASDTAPIRSPDPAASPSPAAPALAQQHRRAQIQARAGEHAVRHLDHGILPAQRHLHATANVLGGRFGGEILFGGVPVPLRGVRRHAAFSFVLPHIDE